MIPTVDDVDLARYAGRWYEIARLPNSFEKDLVGVTATYSLRKRDRIGVLNQGFRGSLSGRRVRARGRARVPYPAKPGRLKVAFFLFFWADYLILDLDRRRYRYALVGTPSKDNLWILSRTPELGGLAYRRLAARARELGYDTGRLIRVPQR